MRLPKIEMCAVLKNSNFNPILKMLINILKEVDQDLIHECPYTEAIIQNKIVKIDSIPSIFAQGHYKSIVNVTNRRSDKILDFEILAYLNSSEKNSFG